MNERREHPRFPITIQANGDTGLTGVLETTDLSAGGAYFLGDPRVEVGGRMWLSLELATTQRGHASIFPLQAEVQIVRKTEAPDGSIFGFGCRWLTVYSREDLTPLNEFLRRTLQIEAGFIETIGTDPSTGPAYAYVFPEAGEAPPATPEPPDPPEAPDAGNTPPQGRGGAIYVLVPLTWSSDEGEWEGRAVKLLPHLMRVATAADLPPAYRRVTLKIPVKQRDKPGVLTLSGTVTTVRRPGNDAAEGQFEVQLTLGNDPEALGAYRKLLDQLSATLGTAGG